VVSSPYKGLTPFTEEDEAFFFGRERERDIIIANFMAYRLTLLYGPSGAGKSSVINAGVVRGLREKDRENQTGGNPPELAVIVFKSWKDNPMQGLSNAILSEAAKASANGHLQPDRSARFDLFLEDCTKRFGCELFIVLDQFEEYFLYHADEDGEGSFAVEFPRALKRPGLRVSFLLSFRDDCLAKLDRFKGRIPRLFDHYLRIDHLDNKAAREAVIRPLRKWNELERPSQPVRVERALVKAILEQVQAGRATFDREWAENAPGIGGRAESHRRIEAPYLQLILQRLWGEEMRTGSSTLRLATLSGLGGAARIVQSHLSRAMSALTADEQEIMASVFHYLVTPSGTKVAYTAEDLSGYAGIPAAQLRLLLERLSASGSRILSPVTGPLGQPAEMRFEIYHDVLAGAVLEYLKQHEIERARRDAEEQRQRAEKEARTASRLRALTAVIVALFVVVLAIVGVAWSQRQARVRQEQVALARLVENEKLRADGLELKDRAFRLQLETDQRRLEVEATNKEKAGLTREAQGLRQQASMARRMVILAQGGTPNDRPIAEPKPIAGQTVTVIWSGDLGPGAELIMQGAQASTGQLTRALPAGPIQVLGITPSSVEVVESPSPVNQWRLKLKNGPRPTESIILSLGGR
jgi:hypothetical protein